MPPCNVQNLPHSRGGDPDQRELHLEPRWLFEKEYPQLPLPRGLDMEVWIEMIMGEEPAPASMDAEAVDSTHRLSRVRWLGAHQPLGGCGSFP